MTLEEAVRMDPSMLVMQCDDRVRVSLERNTRCVPRDGRFHVRVQGFLAFSGSFADAQARFVRARAAQIRRQSAGHRRAAGWHRCPPAASPRLLPRVLSLNGRYPGRRRRSWRSLVPVRPPEPRRGGPR
jgi:hypothetical protein